MSSVVLIISESLLRYYIIHISWLGLVYKNNCMWLSLQLTDFPVITKYIMTIHDKMEHPAKLYTICAWSLVVYFFLCMKLMMAAAHSSDNHLSSSSSHSSLFAATSCCLWTLRSRALDFCRDCMQERVHTIVIRWHIIYYGLLLYIVIERIHQVHIRVTCSKDANNNWSMGVAIEPG